MDKKKYAQRTTLLSITIMSAAYLIAAFVNYDLFWLDVWEIGAEGRLGLVLFTGWSVGLAALGVSMIWQN